MALASALASALALVFFCTAGVVPSAGGGFTAGVGWGPTVCVGKDDCCVSFDGGVGKGCGVSFDGGVGRGGGRRGASDRWWRRGWGA